ncbi:MAG TPA: hypothetical protein VL361_25005 [Candidatus Limnocylindrales bacterium]|nr:hypothetical protein [Candidatus Limnocylindrales bacterium]
MKEQEQNLARLIRAASGPATRPNPAVRERTLQRLQYELRTGREAAAAPERAPELEVNRFERPQIQKDTISRKETIMNKLFRNWGWGLGAIAGAAVVILIVLSPPLKAYGKAVAVISNGARAVARLTSVHLRGRLRTNPNDNFSAIMPDKGFVSIELWKQFSPDLKWRVELPERIAVMDGNSTVLWIKPDFAAKVGPTPSAFDTQLYHEMADVSGALEHEIAAIKAHGLKVTLAQEQGPDGKAKSVVTVEARSGLPDSDYLKNAFFMTADTRRVYVFDNQTELLEAVRFYLHTTSGDQLVFETEQIDYNQAIDPAVFRLDLPANVKWRQDMQVLPDNAKYAAMTPEEAARAYLEALGRKDWTEASKFDSPITDSLKHDRGGLQVISIGKAFTSAVSAINGAQFVPYEIKLKSGETMKHNLALKKDRNTGRWFVDGGI